VRGTYVIYAADRSGNSWHVLQSDNPSYVLAQLAALRAAYHPHRVHGVFEDEREEHGDCENELEEMVYEAFS
jgi:hypothetical protein